MQLTIGYKDGSTRVVNVVQEFFKDAEVRDRHKTTVITPEQKCLDMAHSYGANPYEVLLMEGSTVVFRQVYKANKPESKKSEKPAPDWVGFMRKDEGITAKEVKALKKEKFTKTWSPSREPMSFERAVCLLLGCSEQPNGNNKRSKAKH